jgi:hypothetical protein
MSMNPDTKLGPYEILAPIGRLGVRELAPALKCLGINDLYHKAQVSDSAQRLRRTRACALKKLRLPLNKCFR